ncbi:MAG: dephospho-CoA kinase [Gammaproteobacteria bacterium]|nr:MAG: dephospho-CoA kinase [Gammaproteobacteria bacterium]
MFKVGLTGGIASGKSTVCQLFSELGISIVDADIIARELVMPGQAALSEIINTFGRSILLLDGSLNRTLLRKIIFSDPEKKQLLESILHPRIHHQLKLKSDAASSTYCILAIPLLAETTMNYELNRILVIDIDEQKQVHRLCDRDGLTKAEADNIIKQQAQPSRRKSIADDILINNESLLELKIQVAQLDKVYRGLAL